MRCCTHSTISRSKGPRQPRRSRLCDNHVLLGPESSGLPLRSSLRSAVHPLVSLPPYPSDLNRKRYHFGHSHSGFGLWNVDQLPARYCSRFAPARSSGLGFCSGLVPADLRREPLADDLVVSAAADRSSFRFEHHSFDVVAGD